tara:strand:- start:1 stop:264 length:264 start_codon:yes stop_codon:yes gene_type:complete
MSDENAVDAFINAIVEGLTKSQAFKEWLEKEFSHSDNSDNEDFDIFTYQYEIESIAEEKLAYSLNESISEGIQEYLRDTVFKLEEHV